MLTIIIMHMIGYKIEWTLCRKHLLVLLMVSYFDMKSKNALVNPYTTHKFLIIWQVAGGDIDLWIAIIASERPPVFSKGIKYDSYILPNKFLEM